MSVMVINNTTQCIYTNSSLTVAESYSVYFRYFNLKILSRLVKDVWIKISVASASCSDRGIN